MPFLFPLLLAAACSKTNAWDSPEGKDWIQVEASPADATCGLRMDGTAECWGPDADDGLAPPSDYLVDMALSHLFYGINYDAEIVVGEERGDGVHALDLSDLLDGTRYIDAAAGSAWICGLSEEGALRCTGSSSVISAVPQSGHYAQISGGNWYLCARRADGTASCWDEDSQQIDRLGPYTTLDAGPRGACGVAENGELRCWGDVFVEDDSGPYKDVSVGTAIACALDRQSVIWCWWDPTIVSNVVPPTDGPFIGLAAGTFQVCGLRLDGGISCAQAEAAGE